MEREREREEKLRGESGREKESGRERERGEGGKRERGKMMRWGIDILNIQEDNSTVLNFPLFHQHHHLTCHGGNVEYGPQQQNLPGWSVIQPTSLWTQEV